jgi:hypothetical protein
MQIGVPVRAQLPEIRWLYRYYFTYHFVVTNQKADMEKLYI